MKFAMPAMLLLCCATAAFAQTPLHVQAVVKTDPCAGIDTEDLSSCGMEAFGDGNYAAAQKAWTLASQHGDYRAATWLGEMYAEGKGVKQDYVQAYEWFDIAAALHARCIASEGPAANPAVRDSNQGEIDHRNAAGKKLTAAQLKQAQQASLSWQNANPHAVDKDLNLAD
jgi:TPR repeat protein